MARMPKSAMAAPLGLLFALGACGGPSVSLTNASPEEVAKAASDAGIGMAQQKPGQWEVTTEVVSVEMPGVPAEQRGMMEAMFKRPPVTESTCMTADQLKKPDPALFSGSKANKDCVFRKYNVSNGKLDATMVCKNTDSEMTMTMTGEYAPEKVSTEVTMDAKGPPGQGAVKMKMKSSGRRTGDCPATPAK